jgi:hypothetical protein
MGKRINMDINIGYKDLKNIAGYKSRLLRNLETSFDKKTFVKVENFLNNLTDTLYLPLSHGIRMPAMATACLYYDITTDYWLYRNEPHNSVNLVTGLDVTKQGSLIKYLDATINPELVQKSDVSSLYFIYNNSDVTANVITQDQVIFPRIDRILGDNTVRISLECAKDIVWGFFDHAISYGVPGLCFSLEVLFQSDAENADRAFYTAGIPYFEMSNMYASINSLRPTGYVYSDLEPDASRTLWSSKIRSYAQGWVGDCTSGDGTGGLFYSEWEPLYTEGFHEGLKIEDLLGDTTYKVWVQIDSKVGPDNFDNTSLGCFVTKPIGDDNPDEGDTPIIGAPV